MSEDVEVWVVIAHPDDTASSVVDVFGNREAAETAKRRVKNWITSVEIESYEVAL